MRHRVSSLSHRIVNGTGRHQSLVVVGNLGEGDNTNLAKTDGGVHNFDSDGKVVHLQIYMRHSLHSSMCIEKKERVLNL